MRQYYNGNSNAIELWNTLNEPFATLVSFDMGIFIRSYQLPRILAIGIVFSGLVFSRVAAAAPLLVDVPGNSATFEPGAVSFAGTFESASVSRVRLALYNRSRGAWFDLVDGGYMPPSRFVDAVLSDEDGVTGRWAVDVELDQADYRLYVLGLDNAGRPLRDADGDVDLRSVNLSVGVLDDRQAPQVTLTSPRARSELASGLVDLVGTVEESGGAGLRSVVIAIRDRTAGRWLDVDTGEFGSSFQRFVATLDEPSLDRTGWRASVTLAPGLYETWVLGIDRANNVPRAESGRAIWVRRSFSVADDVQDTIAPTGELTSLRDGDAIPSGRVAFEGVANDDGGSGVKRVSVSLYDRVAKRWVDIVTGDPTSRRTEVGAVLRTPDAAATDWTLDVDIEPGSWSIWVRPVDGAGNRARAWTRKNFLVTERAAPIDPSPWAGPPGPAPNIVMMLADDLGYADLNPVDMPRLHELLRTRGATLPLYTMRNCAPTRAALMTGMLPSRLGITGVDAPPRYRGIDPAEIMLAETLGAAGYDTGVFGKWHLGLYDDQSPLVNGFDEFVGFAHGFVNYYGRRSDGMPYPDGTLGHDHHGRPDMQAAGQPLSDARYSTFLFSDAAQDFIARRTSDGPGTPFFAYVPFNAPHGPYAAPRRYVEALQDRFGISDDELAILAEYEQTVLALPTGSTMDPAVRSRLSKLLYYATVRALDDAAADIVDALIAGGELDDTIVVFASDNGAGVGLGRQGDNGILRDGKGSPYDGGHRVANMVLWPRQYGDVPPAKTDVWIGDLFDTFASAAGIPGGDSSPESSDRLRVLLEGREHGPRENGEVYHVMHVGKEKKKKNELTDAVWAIKRRDVKYVRRIKLDSSGAIADVKEELYDLGRDPGERSNLMRDAAYAATLATVRGHYEDEGGDDMVRAWKTTEVGASWRGYDLPDEWGFAPNPYTY